MTDAMIESRGGALAVMGRAMAWGRVETPVGTLWLASDGDAITATRFDGDAPEALPASVLEIASDMPAVLRGAVRQLEAWVAGRQTALDVPLAPAGTAFQRAVWTELVAIPPGTTTTYGNIAQRIGHPSAVRAVGAANGRNPIAVFIPCHRVIGAGGGLTGYAWGIERKQWLLDHERALSRRT